MGCHCSKEGLRRNSASEKPPQPRIFLYDRRGPSLRDFEATFSETEKEDRKRLIQWFMLCGGDPIRVALRDEAKLGPIKALLVTQGSPARFRPELWRFFLGVSDNRVVPEYILDGKEEAYAKQDSQETMGGSAPSSGSKDTGRGRMPTSGKLSPLLVKSLGHKIILDNIAKDITRTYPDKATFTPALQETLSRFLFAYAVMDKEVGYCQGMNFLAGFLLEVLGNDEHSAFWIFCEILSSTSSGWNLAAMYKEEMPLLKLHMFLLDGLFEMLMPDLRTHLLNMDISPEMYAIKWVMTLFTYTFPFDTVIRLWDFMFVFGPIGMTLCSCAILWRLRKKLLASGPIDVMLEILKAPSISAEDIISTALDIDVDMKSKMREDPAANAETRRYLPASIKGGALPINIPKVALQMNLYRGTLINDIFPGRVRRNSRASNIPQECLDRVGRVKVVLDDLKAQWCEKCPELVDHLEVKPLRNWDDVSSNNSGSQRQRAVKEQNDIDPPNVVDETGSNASATSADDNLEESEAPAEGGLIFKGVEDLAHWSGPETEIAEPKAVTKPPSTAAPRLLMKRAKKQDVEEKRANMEVPVPLVSKHKRTLSEGKEPYYATTTHQGPEHAGGHGRLGGDSTSETKSAGVMITRPKSAEFTHPNRHGPEDQLLAASTRQGLTGPSHKGFHRGSDHSLGRASDHSVGKRSARTHSASRRNRSTRGHSRGNSCSRQSSTDEDTRSPRHSRGEFRLQYRSRNVIEENRSVKRPHELMKSHERQTSGDRITATPALSTASNSTALSTTFPRSFQTPPNRISQPNSAEHPDVMSLKSERSTSSYSSPRNNDFFPPRSVPFDRGNHQHLGSARDHNTRECKREDERGARSDTPKRMGTSPERERNNKIGDQVDRHYVHGQNHINYGGSNSLMSKVGERCRGEFLSHHPISTSTSHADDTIGVDKRHEPTIPRQTNDKGDKGDDDRPQRDPLTRSHSTGSLIHRDTSLSHEAGGDLGDLTTVHGQAAAAAAGDSSVSRRQGRGSFGDGKEDNDSVSRRSINELIKSIDGDLDSSPTSVDSADGTNEEAHAKEPWSAWETKAHTSAMVEHGPAVEVPCADHANIIPHASRGDERSESGNGAERDARAEGGRGSDEGVLSVGTAKTTAAHASVQKDTTTAGAAAAGTEGGAAAGTITAAAAAGAAGARGRLSSNSMDLSTNPRESEVPDVVSVSSYGNFPCEDSPAPRNKPSLPTVTQIAAC